MTAGRYCEVITTPDGEMGVRAEWGRGQLYVMTTSKAPVGRLRLTRRQAEDLISLLERGLDSLRDNEIDGDVTLAEMASEIAWGA